MTHFFENCEPVWPGGEALWAGKRTTSVRFPASALLSLSKTVICGRLVTLCSSRLMKTLKWLFSLPI